MKVIGRRRGTLVNGGLAKIFRQLCEKIVRVLRARKRQATQQSQGHRYRTLSAPPGLDVEPIRDSAQGVAGRVSAMERCKTRAMMDLVGGVVRHGKERQETSIHGWRHVRPRFGKSIPVRDGLLDYWCPFDCEAVVGGSAAPGGNQLTAVMRMACCRMRNVGVTTLTLRRRTANRMTCCQELRSAEGGSADRVRIRQGMIQRHGGEVQCQGSCRGTMRHGQRSVVAMRNGDMTKPRTALGHDSLAGRIHLRQRETLGVCDPS